jgi:hypothetical protein
MLSRHFVRRRSLDRSRERPSTTSSVTTSVGLHPPDAPVHLTCRGLGIFPHAPDQSCFAHPVNRACTRSVAVKPPGCGSPPRRSDPIAPTGFPAGIRCAACLSGCVPTQRSLGRRADLHRPCVLRTAIRPRLRHLGLLAHRSRQASAGSASQGGQARPRPYQRRSRAGWRSAPTRGPCNCHTPYAPHRGIGAV